MEYCSEFVCDPPKRCTSGFLIIAKRKIIIVFILNHAPSVEERKAVKNGNN